MEPEQPEVKELQTEPITQNQKSTKKGQPREPRQKKPRPERKNQYEFNADIIDENTVIPPLPKKNEILPKPQMKNFKEKQLKNRERIEKLIQKKKEMKAQNFKFERKAGKGEDNKHDTFKNEINEAKQIRQKFTELNTERKALREKFTKLIEEAKENNERLKEYRGSLKGSRQNYFEKLEELQHRLLTGDISKEEERALNTDITLIKRKIREAESSGNIEIKLEKCELRKEELDDEIAQLKEEKEPIEAEWQKLRSILDNKNTQITDLKNNITEESKEKKEEREKHQKQWELWKENKKKKIEKIDDEIDKVKLQNNKIWDDFHAKQDEYWKQKQFIDFIEWQTRIKNRKIKDREWAEKKKAYEAKDKEREKQEHLQKYIGEIEQCNFLINYLKNIKPEANKNEVDSKQVKINPGDINAKLASDSQWKKEKGLQVLKSKKFEADEEPDRKQKRQKKKKQQTKQEAFLIPYDVQNMFESLKVLPPTSADQLDKKIQELRDRQKLFERVCKEDPNENDSKLVEEIKGKKNKSKVSQKKRAPEVDDFPTI